MIKKVLLDMDGVITNFHKGVCDAFNREYNFEEMIRYDFWEDWEGPDVTRGDVNSMCNQKFWRSLEWMPEGKETLKIIEEAYGKENIFLFTQPMPHPGSWTGKRLWVCSQMYDYINRLIVTSSPRSLFASPNTLLIDDKDENVDAFIEAGGHAVLIPRPWNKLRRHHVLPHLKKMITVYHDHKFYQELAKENQMPLDIGMLPGSFGIKPSEKLAKHIVKMYFSGSIPVSCEDYMRLSDAYDKHSRTLMTEKGEEYSIENDFLCMENRLAGMMGDTPEKVSLVMAGKHITSLGIILEKQALKEISLAKWDERIRDAMNLLKITSAFIHAKQNDFSLHLGKKECPENAPPAS